MHPVSIVVLNYNYARYLHRSVGSALSQSLSDVQVIVVDDCSTDESREVISQFGDRVTRVFRQKNGGHGAAINSGFARAEGELVVFLDADDYLYPHAARRLFENKKSGVVQYQYRLDLVDAIERNVDSYPPRELRWQDGDVTGHLLSRGRYLTTVTSGLAFDRAKARMFMPMDPEAFRQGGDGYLVTIAPLYGEVKTIDEPLGAYRQHGRNHSQFGNLVAARARWRLEHDEHRLAALRQHASRLGLVCNGKAWRHDLGHLEERAASLVLDPSRHPAPSETRAAIADWALAAVHSLPASKRRRWITRVWWLVVGFGPAWAARSAIVWKLHAPSRPALVRYMARAARRLTA